MKTGHAHQAIAEPLNLYIVMYKLHGPAGRVGCAHVDQGDLPNRKFGEVGDMAHGTFICSTRSKKERWAGFRHRADSVVTMWVGNGKIPYGNIIAGGLAGWANGLPRPRDQREEVGAAG